MSSFSTKINSDGTGLVQYKKVRWCAAENCPFEARIGSDTCEFHEVADPKHWPEVSRRARNHAWMMELYNLGFCRQSKNKELQNLPGFISSFSFCDEKGYITRLVQQHGMDDLIPYDGKRVYYPKPGVAVERNERPYDYGMRILRRMYELIVPDELRRGHIPEAPEKPKAKVEFQPAGDIVEGVVEDIADPLGPNPAF